MPRGNSLSSTSFSRYTAELHEQELWDETDSCVALAKLLHLWERFLICNKDCCEDEVRCAQDAQAVPGSEQMLRTSLLPLLPLQH